VLKVLKYVFSYWAWHLILEVQVILVLHDFTVTQFENLHFSNLHDNFWFNMIWYRQSVVTLIICRMLTGTDVTLTPSVMRVDWLHWWYSHTALLVSCPTSFAVPTNMSEKCKCTSPRAIQVKNRWKTNQYWREITCDKPTCKSWTNFWHML
jgi:hypothetical protein